MKSQRVNTHLGTQEKISETKDNHDTIDFLEVVDTGVRISEKLKEKLIFLTTNTPKFKYIHSEAMTRLRNQEGFGKNNVFSKEGYGTDYYIKLSLDDLITYGINYQDENIVKEIHHFLSETERADIIHTYLRTSDLSDAEKLKLCNINESDSESIVSGLTPDDQKNKLLYTKMKQNVANKIVFDSLSEQEKKDITLKSLSISDKLQMWAFEKMEKVMKSNTPAGVFFDQGKLYLRMVNDNGAPSRMMEIKTGIKDSVNFLDKFPLKRDKEKSAFQSCTYKEYLENKKQVNVQFNYSRGGVTYQDNQLTINNTFKTVIKNVQARCSLSHDTCFVIKDNELYNCIISQEEKVKLEKINTLKIEGTVTSIRVYNDLLVLNTIRSGSRSIGKRIMDTLQGDSGERVLFYDLQKQCLLNTQPFHGSIEPTEIRDMRTGEYLWKMKKNGQLLLLNMKLSDETLDTGGTKKTILMKSVAKELMNNYDSLFEALDGKISNLENKIYQREKSGNWQGAIQDIVDGYTTLVSFILNKEEEKKHDFKSHKAHVDELFTEFVQKLHTICIDDNMVLEYIHGLSQNAPSHKKIYKELYDAVVNTPIML